MEINTTINQINIAINPNKYNNQPRDDDGEGTNGCWGGDGDGDGDGWGWGGKQNNNRP